MKTILFFLFMGFLSNVYAQFPAPTSLVDSLKYAHIGETLSCGGQTYSGGSNCHRFFWSVPDTTGIAAKLKGYKIYHDGVLFQNATEPKYEFEGTRYGKFCVTAIYETPTGESACSDSIVLQSALHLKSRNAEEVRHPTYHKEASLSVLQSREFIPSNRIFDLNGKRVNVSQQKAGIYLIPD